MKNTNRGFIALISSVIIAAILLVLMSEVAAAGFFARFDSLGELDKQQALALADSCVQVALLALASSSSYAPSDQEVDIGTDAHGREERCVINGVTRDGDIATIDASASFGNSFVNVSAQSVVHT